MQSEAFHPAAEVRGCYLNVVGLPVCTLLKTAERFGLRLKPAPEMPWPELERCPECGRQGRRQRQGLPLKQTGKSSEARRTEK